METLKETESETDRDRKSDKKGKRSHAGVEVTMDKSVLFT